MIFWMSGTEGTTGKEVATGSPDAVVSVSPIDRKTLLESLGLACYIAWSFVFWNGPQLLGMGDGSSLIDGAFIAQGAATALAALVLALAVRKISPLRKKNVLLVIFAFISSVSVLVAASPVFSWLPAGFLVVGFLLSGLGSTLRLGWEEYLSVRGVKRTAFCIGIAYAIGFIVFSGISFLPSAAVFGIAMLLPLLSCALLIVAERGARPVVGDGRASGDAAVGENAAVRKDPAPAKEGLKALISRVPWKLLLIIALAYFSYGATRTEGVLGGMAASSSIHVALAGIPALACIVGVALAYCFYRKNAVLAFYIAFPLMALASLLPAALDPFSGGTTFCVTLVGAELVKYLVWFLFIDAIIKDGVSVLLCLGLMRAAQWAGSTLGQVTTDVLHTPEAVTIAILLSLMIALLVIIGAPFVGRTRGEGGRKSESTLEDRVSELSRDCHLSPRETEVLGIWATGRSGAYIEKTLFISKNTVKTHLNHIYAKTGTANREELLELLDSLDAEGSVDIR